jgi:isoaspartyl peptidase/L-asparaginase-like protein (Ntn-hydrolase superfamily)
VVRDSEGRFAATASTGGTLYMLRGRVGDSPLMGCGVYAGPKGAVAAHLLPVFGVEGFVRICAVHIICLYYS